VPPKKVALLFSVRNQKAGLILPVFEQELHDLIGGLHMGRFDMGKIGSLFLLLGHVRVKRACFK